MMKPDVRPGITIQPQWSCSGIAHSLNLKKKIQMNKEKIFTIIACVGFWGMMICPALVLLFAIGVLGIYKSGKTDDEIV